jgi:hypothetical protein
METWLREGTLKSILLVVGTPGCGASSTLEQHLRELDIEAVWFSPGAAKLRASLLDAGCSAFSATGRRKIIVLDGFDAMMGDVNACADIAFFIRKALPAPAIFLAHRTRTIHKRFRDLFTAASFAGRTRTIELDPPSPTTVRSILRDAAPPDMDEDTIDAIWQKAKGDVRAALRAVEFRSKDAVKDEIPESYAVVEKALHGEYKTVVDATLAAAAESTVISYGIFERYGFSPDVADAFSLADVMEEYMFAHQRWELVDSYAVIGVAIPSLLPKEPRPKKASEKFTYGVVWSKLHLQACRAKHVKTIATQRADARLPFIPVEDMAYVRGMILQCDAAKDWETLRRVAHGLRPDGVLALMRLWSCKYTQSVHSRVTKHLSR